MQTNHQFLRFSGATGYFLIVLMVVAIIAGINWLISEQKKTKQSQLAENTLTDSPVQQKFEQENSETSFSGFLSSLEQAQLRLMCKDVTILSNSNNELPTENDSLKNEEMMAQRNHELIESQRLKKEAEYQQLIVAFSQQEGVDKVLLLQKIWQLAPEVGIDENLLTLLDLATHDPDAKIENIANKILRDLIRFRDGVVQPEVQLVSQINEINNTQQRNADLSEDSDELHNFELLEPSVNSKYSSSSVEMTHQRDVKINQLKQLAISSEDEDQKDYALINLMQFDHDSALEVIQYQLLNNQNTDERYRAIKKLRAVSGDISSLKLRRLLEIATNDYQTSIAEYARASITMLDQYEKDLSEENTIIDDDFIDTQELTYDDSAGYGGPR